MKQTYVLRDEEYLELRIKPSTQAGFEHFWHGRRVLAVDGFAFSMPDTPENQRLQRSF